MLRGCRRSPQQSSNSAGVALFTLAACLLGSALSTDSHEQESGSRTNPVDGAVMVRVSAGNFVMGSSDADFAQILKADPQSEAATLFSEKPARTIYLDSYWIYRTEVTVAQYRKFCNATGHSMPPAPGDGWRDNHPVVNVTWSDAHAYAKWAGVALPTEAQWEKAARGTDGRRYVWGNSWPPPAKSGNFADVSVRKRFRNWRIIEGYDDDWIETAPVGSFPAGVSPYGCMDMVGNVWEWCADWYDPQYYTKSPPANPSGPASGRHRILRGGSWANFGADFLRPAKRNRKAPDECDDKTGFRCVSS